MERKNAELKYYFEQSDRNCKRYRRERDEVREYISRLDKLQNIRKLEREIHELRQQLRQMLAEKDAELQIANGQFQEVVSRKERIIQNLEEKIKQRDLKVQHLESRLSIENSRTRGESTSRKAIHDDDHYISDLRKQLQETLARLREAQAELDETKSR